METNLADAGDGDGQESIQVDLSAENPEKSVVRSRGTPRAGKGDTSKDADWMQRSKEVSKRVARLQRSFQQQMADQQAEHQRELRAANDRISKLEGRGGDAATGDEATHEARMMELQAELEDAQERGDSKKVGELTRKMATAEGQFWSAKTAKQLGANGQGAGATTTNTPANGGQRTPTTAGNRWTTANGEWWNDTDEESIMAKGVANALHVQMVKEGSDPNSDEHYEVIRNKLVKRFPNIEFVSTAKQQSRRNDTEVDDDPDGEAEHRRRPVSTMLPDRGSAGAGTRRSSNSTILNKADIANMRAVGLDPGNNKHVVQYIKEGQEIEANA